MNAKIDNFSATITLSKRNLLALLDKVDRSRESARTIYKQCGGVLVQVSAQTDDEHYGDREAGRMEHGTEVRIQDQGAYSTVA